MAEDTDTGARGDGGDFDDASGRALDEMLEHAPPVLRRSLGIAVDE